MNIYYARERLRTGSIFDLKLKVAYYARVSTEKMEQQVSIKHQQEYYEEFIRSNQNWTFSGAYIDDGISGMHTEKREEFQNMIQDAKLGRVDMIITKEISRFARNTLDSIQYTRELLSYGVCVWFQNDGINTIDEDSEFRLTIMAGVAQDELRKLSSRIKFGHARSIQNGVVLGNRIYGYHKKDGKLTIVPEEAEMVRMIFRDYAAGVSTPKIEKKLWDMGYRNSKGSKIDRNVIRHIIKNPKYKGYFCGGKVKIVDMFTKKQEFIPESEWVMFKDDGSRVPQIIDEETWEKANQYMTMRGDAIKTRRTSFKSENLFTGMIFCSNDNAPYWLKQHYIRGKEDVRWVCSHKIKNGAASCNSFGIKESELKIMVSELINESSCNIEEVIKKYLELLRRATDNKPDSKAEIDRLQKQIESINKKKEKILEYNLDGNISDEEFIQRNKGYNEQIEKLNSQISDLTPNQDDFVSTEMQFKNIIDTLKKFNGVEPEDINRQIVEELFEKIVVKSFEGNKATLTFYLKTGEVKKKQVSMSCSEYMLNNIISERHKRFYRKTCISGASEIAFNYEYRMVI